MAGSSPTVVGDLPAIPGSPGTSGGGRAKKMGEFPRQIQLDMVAEPWSVDRLRLQGIRREVPREANPRGISLGGFQEHLGSPPCLVQWGVLSGSLELGGRGRAHLEMREPHREFPRAHLRGHLKEEPRRSLELHRVGGSWHWGGSSLEGAGAGRSREVWGGSGGWRGGRWEQEAAPRV